MSKSYYSWPVVFTNALTTGRSFFPMQPILAFSKSVLPFPLQHMSIIFLTDIQLSQLPKLDVGF